MNKLSYTISEASVSDQQRCIELVTTAFEAAFKRMLGRIPPGLTEGQRISRRYLREDAKALIAKAEDGSIGAVAYMQCAGTRTLGGPLAVDASWQSPWKQGVAQSLLEAMIEKAFDNGGGIIDSVTFPQSPVHFDLYWKYGIPFCPAPFFSRGTRCMVTPCIDSGGTHVVTLSQLVGSDLQSALADCRAVTDAFWPGLDHSSDLQHVLKQSIGDAVLVFVQARVVGWAIFHLGPGSESFAMDEILVKLLFVDHGHPRSRDIFHLILQHIEEYAVRSGVPTIGMMASASRRSTIEALKERGYRTTQMHTQMLWAPGESAQLVQDIARSSFLHDQLALVEWR